LKSIELFSLELNQLSGEIPPEIGSLTSLMGIYLSSNQLSGEIPPEIGSLRKLEHLYLHWNRLSGPIPPEIGNLSNLQSLYLHCNRLSGEIPTELGGLTNLSPAIPIPAGLDLRWNALYSNNTGLVTFLESKQSGGDWQSTQTVAPDGVTVISVGDHTAWLEWTPIIYTAHGGGYQVHSAELPGGAMVAGGWTDGKTATVFPMTGLQPGQSYDLLVGTLTDPHDNNPSTVVSELGAGQMVTTSDTGCAAPQVSVSSTCPTVLTVVSSHGSYEWSTLETTTSIEVQPATATWYWVRAFGPGSCDEAVQVFVRSCIFSDGFESSDTSAWSLVVAQ
jgi:hypothetical protein